MIVLNVCKWTFNKHSLSEETISPEECTPLALPIVLTEHKCERILDLTIPDPYIQWHNNKLQFSQLSSGDQLHPWKDEERTWYHPWEDSLVLPSATHWIAKEKISAISKNPQHIPGTDCMRYSEVSKQKINLLPGKTRIIVCNHFCFTSDIELLLQKCGKSSSVCPEVWLFYQRILVV